MSEPKTLEEALAGYEANTFSRKKLFRFVIDRLMAAEARIATVEGKYAEVLAAMVRPENGAVEPPQAGLSQSEKMKAIWAKRKAAQAEVGVEGVPVSG